jgi:ankyrin repeat protein
MGPNERALLKAASKGAVNEILVLLRNGTHLDAINEEGQSALTMAISRQHMNVVKLLVESGATMDRSGFLVHKPLHVAVATRNVDLVKYILDNNADPNEVSTVGSVLLIAVSARQENIVTLLLSRNADPNISGSGIRSPLFKAISTKQEPFIPMLLKHGAKVDKHQYAAVYLRRLSPACRNLLNDWALQEEYSEQVKTLRSEYVDKTQKETALLSALSRASENGHEEVHSIFMDLAAEFAILVGEEHKYIGKSSK